MIYGALGELALGEVETTATGDNIRPSSIPSAEAFGVPVISGNLAIIGAGGIASAEAFGEPTIQENTGYITDVGGIASAEAFGVPSVVAIIAPASIDGAEAFGSPSLYELVFYKPVSRIR